MGQGVHRLTTARAREHDIILGLENHYKDGYWRYPEFASAWTSSSRCWTPFPSGRTSACSTTPSNAIVAGDDLVELLRRVADRGQHARQRPLPGRRAQPWPTSSRPTA
ncbi:MAG: hypothetical protein R2838_16590 [Caldilineaceae bacterium]